MSDPPAAPPRRTFDAQANAERIRRLNEDAPPPEHPRRRRRDGAQWTLANLVVVGALGVLALGLLAGEVLGLPVEMMGGKLVFVVPVLLIAFMVRGAR